ncbi:actin cytoskeleton-regulatory complex protein PAN1-like [Brachypodium distachyon]|uniref:actin cytoskeleton-regulatory complex protein PAN1-like n=1 Tax=Brachypodium distachyon TaxID=15368 RepID=UPI00052FF6F0|nr:actin cytoskeleton-regulatory complex protein PAN1-like [Brachypodium distachyon]|eukprot:XP_010239458.1 actin cytoskeleton-regulatory complex protein PAN1-like [Brachypodium distachyon]
MAASNPAAPASSEYSPAMGWILTGPAPPMIGEDDDFAAALAPPPLPLFCPVHGYGPCPARDGTAPLLPSPTPPAPGAEAAPLVADAGPPAADSAPPPASNLVPPPYEDEGEVVDDVHPEARRFLRKFAAAMAAHRDGPAGGGWNPAALGFSSSNEGGLPYSI